MLSEPHVPEMEPDPYLIDTLLTVLSSALKEVLAAGLNNTTGVVALEFSEGIVHV